MSILANFRAFTPGGKYFCHRCRAAAIYALTDEDEERAEEEYYAYLLRISEFDKSKLLGEDPKTRDRFCKHCGHKMRLGQGNQVFNQSP